MATTFKSRGNTRTWTNSTGGDVAAGALVILRSGASGEVGVTVNAVANGATGTVHVSGVHTLTGATGAISAHAVVYRNSSAAVTATSTSNTLAGVATAAKTTSGTSVTVLLNGRPGSDT